MCSAAINFFIGGSRSLRCDRVIARSSYALPALALVNTGMFLVLDRHVPIG